MKRVKENEALRKKVNQFKSSYHVINESPVKLLRRRERIEDVVRQDLHKLNYVSFTPMQEVELVYLLDGYEYSATVIAGFDAVQYVDDRSENKKDEYYSEDISLVHFIGEYAKVYHGMRLRKSERVVKSLDSFAIK